MPLRKSGHDEDEERHDRWLVSYADFLTLLFAFFVVMYAVSSINAGKYRVLTDSLGSAFREPLTRIMPIDLGGGMRESGDEPTDSMGETPAPLTGAASELEEASLEPVVPDDTGEYPPETPGIELKNMDEAGDYLRQNLAGVVDDENFEVRNGENWLQIELKSELLFGSGSADIATPAIPIVDRIAPALRALPGEVRVEGFTDDRPVKSVRFPSNWELSAARAGSIVRRFAIHGVGPERMSAIGFGEYRPVADNMTAEGRQANRRVVIVVTTVPEIDIAAGDESSVQTQDGPVVLQHVTELPGRIGLLDVP